MPMSMSMSMLPLFVAVAAVVVVVGGDDVLDFATKGYTKYQMLKMKGFD